MDNFNKKTFLKRFPKKALQFLLIMVLIAGWLYSGWPQINFEYKDFSFTYPTKPQIAHAAVTYSTDCDGTIQTAASAVAISACDVGTGLTDAILIISVFGDDGGGTHGAPTVTRGTGSVCGTGTETATIIDTEVSSGDASVSTYRLLDANFAEGSADVCVSWASSDPPDEWSAHITVFTGVDQTTFTSDTNSATFGNVDVITGTVTIAANEHGYQANTCNTNAAVTTLNADDVERFILITGGADKSASHVSTQTVTGSPATMGVDLYSKACVVAAMKLITLNDAPAGTTFEQRAYRWFSNADSSIPGSVLAAQDATSTLSTADAKFRLRLLILIGSLNLAVDGENFKLQFAGKGSGSCVSPSFTYADVATSTAIAFFQNSHASTTDAAPLGPHAEDPTDGGSTIINQDYKEYRDFTNSEAAINTTENGKWDFSLYDNNATSSATFCFRVVKSDDSTLDTYNVYPALIIASAATGGAGGSSDPSGGGTPTTGGGEGGDDATESGSGGGTPTSGGGASGGGGASPTLLDLLNELIKW